MDMGQVGQYWTHHMYEYDPEYVHNEDAYPAMWQKRPDRRVRPFVYSATTANILLGS